MEQTSSHPMFQLWGSLVSWVEASFFHKITVQFPTVRLISLVQEGQNHRLLLPAIYSWYIDSAVKAVSHYMILGQCPEPGVNDCSPWMERLPQHTQPLS